LFIPCYATLHLSLIVLLILTKKGHNFKVFSAQNWVKFLGFWNRRFDGPNREAFGYELKSFWSSFKVELRQIWGKKGMDLGVFEGVICKANLKVGHESFKG
jgi:hypothetical protein